MRVALLTALATACRVIGYRLRWLHLTMKRRAVVALAFGFSREVLPHCGALALEQSS